LKVLAVACGLESGGWAKVACLSCS
jgi:hypothetical protein